jgi:WD40 repeat protein
MSNLGARTITGPWTLLIAPLLLFFSRESIGSPWAIIANSQDRTIQTMDLGTVPPTVYGPFLRNDILSTNPLGPIAVVPGERYAVVASTTGPLYLVDISNPRAPSLVHMFNTRQFVSGLAVSPDGNLAIPTQETAFVTVNLINFQINGHSFPVLGSEVPRPTSVAIGGDNSTTVFADLVAGRVIYGRMNEERTALEGIDTIPATAPLNVVVASDGQTVLLAHSALISGISVFHVASPGVLTAGTPAIVPLNSSEIRLLAVQPTTSNVVYALSARPLSVSTLQVTAPGEVRVLAEHIVDVPPLGGGVSALAVTPDGSFLVIGNSIGPEIGVIKLSDLSVSTVLTGGSFPQAIATFNGPVGPAEPIPLLSSFAIVAMVIALVGVAWVILSRT